MKKLGLGLLFLMMILVAGASFIFYTEGADAFSTKIVKIGEKHAINGNKINNIQVTTDSTDVEITPYSGSNIKVEFSGRVSEKLKDAFLLEVSELNGTLHVDLERLTRPSFTVFALNKGTLLTILVPAKTYKEIMIKSTSGDIQGKDLVSDTVHLKATSGDITAENLTTHSKINMETTSGDIHSVKSIGSETTYEATSGDVSVNMENQSFALDFQASSGEGEVKVAGFQFEEMTENRILGKKGKGDPSIIVRTTSGDFNLQ